MNPAVLNNEIDNLRKSGLNAIILAGGDSSRMGFDKTFIKVEGLTLIERQIKLLYNSLFEKIIVVTNSQRKSYSLYEIADKNRFKKMEIIQDISLGQGPLGGIYSGLITSNSFYNFVVACDMPYIDSGFIEYMYKKSSGYDAVVPRVNKRYEPLYSLYSKNCLKFIKQLLDKKMFRINKLFLKIKFKEITRDEVGRFAFGAKIFTNINTREDLANVYADRQI